MAKLKKSLNCFSDLGSHLWGGAAMGRVLLVTDHANAGTAELAPEEH